MTPSALSPVGGSSNNPVTEIVTINVTPTGAIRRACVEIIIFPDHVAYDWYVLEYDPASEQWLPLYTPYWWPDDALPPLTLMALPLDVTHINGKPLRRVNMPASGGRAGSFSEAMSYCRQWLYA